MCGILGYHSYRTTEKELEILAKLFKESVIRGMHAYGFAIGSPGEELIVERHFDLRESLISLTLLMKEFINKECLVIAHCRYDTSGDWKVLENNQPIVSRKNILVFNGVVRMSTKEEYEMEFGEFYKTDNDGEIVLRILEQSQNNVPVEERKDGILNLCKESRVSFSGIYYVDGKSVAYRNKKRPLYISETKEQNSETSTRWIASTKDIFLRSGFSDCQEVAPFSMVELS